MTRPYQVGGQPNCTGAASSRRQQGRGELAGRPEEGHAGPADRDHPVRQRGHDGPGPPGPDHGSRHRLPHRRRGGGQRAARKFGHDIAWPPGGTADLSVLTSLAAHQHVGTVVLNSGEMPPVVDAANVFQPDDAVTSLRVAGLPMNVLLSDDTLTAVLRAGNTSSGTLPKSTEFAVRQRFLAETAMIAAEAPDSERTIVVAPPGDWSPSEALASDLLGETSAAPWLTPTPLASLSSVPDTQRAAPRHSPPASQASPGEAQPRLPEAGAHPRRPGSACTSRCSTSPRSPTRAPWTRPCSPRSRPPGAAAGSRRGRRWSVACPTTSRPRTRRSDSSPRPRCRWAVPPGWSRCRSRTGCIRPSGSG